jgi:hypothetical protein
VSTLPANNPCHGFSVIAGVVDTGDKFFTSVSNTGEQLLSLTPVNSLSVAALTPAIKFFPGVIDAVQK